MCATEGSVTCVGILHFKLLLRPLYLSVQFNCTCSFRVFGHVRKNLIYSKFSGKKIKQLYWLCDTECLVYGPAYILHHVMSSRFVMPLAKAYIENVEVPYD